MINKCETDAGIMLLPRGIFSLGQKSFFEKIFFVLLLLCIYQENNAIEDCDFVKCIVGVKEFLLDLKKTQTSSFSCKQLTDIPECSESCMQKYFPNLILQENLNHPTFSELCVENISKRLNVNWPCISRHTFRLLTCFANVSSITTNSVQDDVIVSESCRKNLEFQNCPSQVLLDCGEESVNVVNDMLLFILNHLKPSCKGVDIKELLFMPVHYHLEDNLMQVAASFDTHFSTVTACFEQLIQEESDLGDYLCGSYDPLSKCIQFSLTGHNKAFPVVRHLVLSLFSVADFKCRMGSAVPKPLSTLPTEKSLMPFSERDKTFSYKSDKVYDFLESSTKLSSEKSIKFHSKNTETKSVSTETVSVSTETVSVSSQLNETEKKQMKDKIHEEVPLKDSPIDGNKDRKQTNDFSEERDKINYLKASGGVKLFVSRTLWFIIIILYVFR